MKSFLPNSDKLHKEISKPLTTILFVGHLSAFGFACLDAILSSRMLDVKEIVLGSYSLWKSFNLKLSGKPPNVDLLYNYLRATLLTNIRYRHIHIRKVDTANSAVEASNVSGFDVLVSAAFPQIFESSLIESPRIAAVNLHPSFLPRCRGAHPMYWTIATREPYGGLTCHMLTLEIDRGPIVARRKIEFNPSTITMAQLTKRVFRELPYLVADMDDFFCHGKQPVAQESNYTYFTNPRSADYKVRFSQDNPDKICAKIRAGNAFALTDQNSIIRFMPPCRLEECDQEYYKEIVDFTESECLIVDSSAQELLLQTGNKLLRTGYKRQPKSLAVKVIRRLAPRTMARRHRLVPGEKLH